MKVLHLTPHLGGGVGCALLGVAKNVSEDIQHCFICLEAPEKTQFINAIRDLECQVIVAPSQAEIVREIKCSDIVQLEWWCHPALLKCLGQLPEVSLRLIVWCHVSGLYGQVIPEKLLTSATRFLFTSACSMQAEVVQQLGFAKRQHLGVVHSNGGFESWPLSSACNENSPLAVGYIGSLNFAKLHPDYVAFLASVPLSDFKINLIGDELNKEIMLQQASALGKTKLLDFVGYTENVVDKLSKINVLAYLLNPTHYGTNENALLEAMAMAIVPIVLNNPAECEIIEHGVTGLVVDSMDGFSQAIEWLNQYPQKRTQLGAQAAKAVKKKHTKQNLKKQFREHFDAVMLQDKQPLHFSDVFGTEPTDWFLSCQQDKNIFTANGPVNLPNNPNFHHSLTETSKGSVLHFQRYFSDDITLSKWAKQVVL